ncbi:ribosome maturation factor RimM [Tuberibacillus sp. Marseille-P3662]|uniref:ribosome maturation factor RimM n=1 Tax=Tuberibacillus sp. Marseille-P3662 TaxID=1965358 RepID=UPI000A1C8142|nr:ribosome maturation factor RimM [Tuberibacillus sp. Marseille-P3662]
MKQEWFHVGKIVNMHGLRGEVRVMSSTDFEDKRFAEDAVLYIGKDDTNKTPVTVSGHRIHKQFHLLTFAGYESIEDVEWMKGQLLFVSKEQLEPLGDNEFYYHEIIGCDVYSEAGDYIGRVNEILSPGANDVWVVGRNGEDVLIPYIEDVVKAIDVSNNTIKIHLLDGLMDDED